MDNGGVRRGIEVILFSPPAGIAYRGVRTKASGNLSSAPTASYMPACAGTPKRCASLLASATTRMPQHPRASERGVGAAADITLPHRNESVSTLLGRQLKWMVIDRLLRWRLNWRILFESTTSLKPVHGGEALRRRDHVVA